MVYGPTDPQNNLDGEFDADELLRFPGRLNIDDLAPASLPLPASYRPNQRNVVLSGPPAPAPMKGKK
jgi:hypothetical protein